jgi:hypothetical protein
VTTSAIHSQDCKKLSEIIGYLWHKWTQVPPVLNPLHAHNRYGAGNRVRLWDTQVLNEIFAGGLASRNAVVKYTPETYKHDKLVAAWANFWGVVE